MHASIACLLLYEDYVWVSLGNAMKAKQSKAYILVCHFNVKPTLSSLHKFLQCDVKRRVMWNPHIVVFISYNNIQLEKFYSLDFFVTFTSFTHLGLLTIEYCYYRFYQNKNIDLDIRIKSSHLTRFKNLTRIFVLTLIAGVTASCSGYFGAAA